LQGFLGGQAEAPEALIPSERRRIELAGQVVAGHQQYQNAINAQPQFRRAFAEVLHRRSLLFLGSGILEDYLVNLFGEIAHHYGPGPHPHFALFPKDRQDSLDASFLQTRLGIIPVFYEHPSGRHYEALPGLLERFADAVSGTGQARTRTAPPIAWMPDELGFSLTDGSRPPFGPGARLKLRYAALPSPLRERRECVIVSVGRGPDHRPLLGSQAQALLAQTQQAGLLEDVREQDWRPLGATPSFVFRLGEEPLFGVAARLRNPPEDGSTEGPPDRRDLGLISDAVYEALRAASEAGFRTVHLGPVASGRYRLWHPIHPFVQTLLGVRRFFTEHPTTALQELGLYVMSPAVWSPILAGKVPVADILSSDVMKIWVDIRDPEGSSEIFAVIASGPTPVGDLKRSIGLAPERWSAEVLPMRRQGPASVEPDDVRVAPMSIVVFSPRS
jgi:hypothetical protein